MAKFRRKQVEVEAVQFVDGRHGEAIDFCPKLTVKFGFVQEQSKPETKQRNIESAYIDALEVKQGDWIIKGKDGAFGVMGAAAFLDEFEAV